MKDEKAKEVKKEKKSDDGATLAYIARRVDKVVKWLEEKHGADIDGSGTVGFARIGTMVLACVVTLVIGLGIVVAENIDDKSAGTGTYSLDQASNGTGDITLTVDAVTADVTGTVTSDGAPVTTFGNGSLNTTNVTSVVENGDGLSHQTVITLTGTASSIADGGFEASQLLYTFPEGAVLFEGCVADLTLTMATTNFNASTDDLYNVAIGTAVNDDGDGTISATGANLIANQSVDTDGGQTQTNSVTAHLATVIIVDGTSTANSMYLNWAVPAANDNGANTNSITGTITVTWKKLGDY